MAFREAVFGNRLEVKTSKNVITLRCKRVRGWRRHSCTPPPNGGSRKGIDGEQRAGQSVAGAAYRQPSTRHRCRRWSSGQGGGTLRLGGILLRRASQPAHAESLSAGGAGRFLAWAEGQGVELAAITPGMVGQYLVGLGGSPAKRNQHLAALRGFFDRLVNRHVCILNPAASVKGVKDQVVEGKTPEITIDHARKLLARSSCPVRSR